MVECARCGVDEVDVRLFDAIYDGRMAFICERCAVIENIPIIKQPGSNQLKESEQALGVYDRMKRMTGIIPQKKEETFFVGDRLKELDKHPELELPEKKKLNLIDHFHWHVMKERRRKGFTQEKLAEAIGESLIAIQMIEKGKLPENSESLVRKLEQIFQVRLRNITETERILQRNQRKPILLNEKGDILDSVPEEEFEIIKQDAEEFKEPEIHCKVERRDIQEPVVECRLDKPVLKPQEVDIKHMNPSAITIADLRALHRRKIEATKQEKLEEQKKIEERQKLIEAKKEELRALKEKESKELDKVLGGTELLGKDNKKQNVEEFDDELI
ncbi:MAG: helix-turn-helix transcriptional regulator [Candidatus Pacearchaeota archaeon]